jgi:hypothetical protein
MVLLGFYAEIIHASVHMTAYVVIPVDILPIGYTMYIHYCLN